MYAWHIKEFVRARTEHQEFPACTHGTLGICTHGPFGITCLHAWHIMDALRARMAHEGCGRGVEGSSERYWKEVGLIF